MPKAEKIVPLPLLRTGSIEDTLAGFAQQIEKNGHLGRRVAQSVTVLAAEIRGWTKIRERLGPDLAERMLSMALDRVLEAVDDLGPGDVSLSGAPTQPIVTVAFSDNQDALRAVATAQAIRDAVARRLHPSFRDQFGACIGINSGTVSETRVAGSGIEFQATGTIRMFATRLQEFAGPDQVFISESTYRRIPSQLDVVAIGPVRTSGDGTSEPAYCLRGLIPQGATW